MVRLVVGRLISGILVIVGTSLRVARVGRGSSCIWVGLTVGPGLTVRSRLTVRAVRLAVVVALLLGVRTGSVRLPVGRLLLVVASARGCLLAVGILLPVRSLLCALVVAGLLSALVLVIASRGR